MSNSVYATVDYYKLVTGTETSAKDDRILNTLGSASRQIDRLVGRHYENISTMSPIVGIKLFDALPRHRSTMGILVSDRRDFGLTGQIYTDFNFDITVDNRGYLNILDLYGYEFTGEPILNIGGTVIDSEDYLLYPPSTTCKNKIILVDSVFQSLNIYRYSDYRSAISIDATWVKRVEDGDGWFNYNTNLNSDIDSETTTFTVAPPSNGHEFSAGDIIRIGNEIMNVVHVQGHDITVKKRGDEGTISASYLEGTNIEYYVPDLLLQDATVVYARLNVKQPGGTMFMSDTGAIFREDAEYYHRVSNLTLPYKYMEY